MVGLTGYITSLVEWLDEVGLAIHLPGMIYNSPLAVWIKVKEGYQMKGEGASINLYNESIPIRSHQHWEIKGGILEIVSVNNGTVQGIRWNKPGNATRNGTIVVAEDCDIKGAGSNFSMSTSELLGSKRLAIVKRVKPGVRGRMKMVMEMRSRRPQVNTPLHPNHGCVLSGIDLMEFDSVFTDGSWRKSETLRSLLKGEGQINAGGAIVLCKGGKRMVGIRIEIDVEEESAFEVELISLIIAIKIYKGSPMTIFSDCKSALAVLNGKHRGSFFSILGGWRKSENCILEKVKAHPEKFKKPEEWDYCDKGIWAADQIAGDTLTPAITIKASTWLSLISYTSKAIVVDCNGLPFVKDISKRWGKYLIDSYLKDRDEYRVKGGNREYGRALISA